MERIEFYTDFVEELQEVSTAALDGLDPFSIEFVQTERGPLGARLTEVVAEPPPHAGPPLFQLSEERLARGLHLRGAPPTSGISIFAFDSPVPARWNGCQVERGDILTLAAGEEFDLALPASADVLVCHVEPAIAGRFAPRPGPARIQSRHAAGARFVAAIRAWLESPDPNAFQGCSFQSSATIEVLEAAGELVEGTDEASNGRLTDRPASLRVARAALELMTEAHSRPLSSLEICDAINVSRRTLENACMRHLGAAPVSYHQRLRMHAARRDLLEARAGEAKVSSVANGRGFAHLGRFSREFKALFGESPSQTLSR